MSRSDDAEKVRVTGGVASHLFLSMLLVRLSNLTDAPLLHGLDNLVR